MSGIIKKRITAHTTIDIKDYENLMSVAAIHEHNVSAEIRWCIDRAAPHFHVFEPYEGKASDLRKDQLRQWGDDDITHEYKQLSVQISNEQDEILRRGVRYYEGRSRAYVLRALIKERLDENGY